MRTTVPRVLGGTLIIDIPSPPATTSITAIGRDGKQTTVGRDGQQTAMGRDGQVSGKGR